jgi:hypothetical protein
MYREADFLATEPDAQTVNWTRVENSFTGEDIETAITPDLTARV